MIVRARSILYRHDFTGDGRVDFAAMVSQAFECVDLFINQGDGRFHLHGVWAAPDLTFGSSGMELVDLNQNGKMDILFTNGDSFDNLYANPSHGIQWLENLGDLQFAYHRLTDCPVRTEPWPATLIGMAIWTSSPAPGCRGKSSRSSCGPARLTSIVFLEQTSPGQFVPHTLEADFPSYPAMEIGDFDGDGDLDFAVGVNMGLDGSESSGFPHVVIWWNQAIPSGW
jgi:hypothetical protein